MNTSPKSPPQYSGSLYFDFADRLFELYDRALVWHCRTIPTRSSITNDESSIFDGCVDLQDTICLEVPNSETEFIITGPNLKTTIRLRAPNVAQRLEWMRYLDEAKRKPKLGKSKGYNWLVQDTLLTQSPIFWFPKNVSCPSMLDYCIEERREYGTSSKVYAAKHVATDQHCCVKVYERLTFLRDSVVLTKQEENIFELCLKLRHPYVVATQCLFVDSTKPSRRFIAVQELLTKEDIITCLTREECFDEHRTRIYFAQMCSAIQYLHDNDIVPGVIALENFRFDSNGHLKYTSFMRALLKDKHEYSSGASHGGPDYCAPEILMGSKSITRAADWYSLGCILYEMLCGLPPFYSEVVQDMYHMIISSPVEFSEKFSAEAKDLCQQLLLKDPKRRLGGEDVKRHPYFRGINWDKLGRGDVIAPWIPQ